MLQAKHKTGLVFFPAFDWAISPTHPEREERLLYTQDQVFEEGILDIPGIEELKPCLVDAQDIHRAHFCVPDVPSVTTQSHFISAGGAKAVGMAVMEKRVDKGFALVRPPGHHAGRVVHGARGFCNINIEAVMIEYLREAYGIRKVAVVDTDCHHGDGTQDIYWHDPDTLFISLHQDGRTLYPGSGFPNELGGANAVGTTLNIPLPPQTSDEGILQIIRHAVIPILEEFKPDLVVNSAGQDNHFSDPITNMNFTAKGYADLTTLLKPDLAVLEGGYAIEGALPYVNTGIILAMAGLEYDRVREPDYNPENLRQSRNINQWVDQVTAMTLENWDKRHGLMEEAQAGKDLEERERTIFYDTDQISETQRESVRICSDCGGSWRIDSTTQRNGRILAVHIPHHACNRCLDAGNRWFESAECGDFNRIFLQDLASDRFLVRTS